MSEERTAFDLEHVGKVPDFVVCHPGEIHKIRDEVALESNEKGVKIGENLRKRWVTDQAADPELHEDIQRLRKSKGVGEEYKIFRMAFWKFA